MNCTFGTLSPMRAREVLAQIIAFTTAGISTQSPVSISAWDCEVRDSGPTQCTMPIKSRPNDHEGGDVQ